MMDQSMEQSLPSSCFRLPNPLSSPYDVGFHFVPTDVELLHYFQDKVLNPSYDPGLIMTTDVYKHEPWFLHWDPADDFLFHGYERYFFVQRKPFSGRDTGTRPRRTIDSWWNSNTDDKPIYDEGGMVMGFVKSLTFFVKDEAKKRKAGDSKNRKQDGIKTDWIMHEYMLEQWKVRQWVRCRIHYNGKLPLSFSSSPQMTLKCSGGPDMLEPPPRASHCRGGPDDLVQPSPSKRLKSSRVQQSESQPLEVQESLVLAGVDGDAEEEIASWVDSLICDLV